MANAIDKTPSYLLETERNNIEVFSQRSPLVVFVHNLRYQMNLFSRETQQIPQGIGSGFIWDNKGHIVTNHHVVNGANEISISLKNGKKNYKAKLIGIEPRKDIAVIKIKVDKYYPKRNNAGSDHLRNIPGK